MTVGYVRGNPVTGIDPSGLVNWRRLAFGVFDFALSTTEAASGLGIMIASPVLGPAAPVSFTGGTFVAAHGTLGMLNSGLEIEHALYETSGPGFLEYVAGVFFGDSGGKAGAAADLFLGVRPAAIYAGGMTKLSDVYELASGLNTMDNTFSTSPEDCR